MGKKNEYSVIVKHVHLVRQLQVMRLEHDTRNDSPIDDLYG